MPSVQIAKFFQRFALATSIAMTGALYPLVDAGVTLERTFESPGFPTFNGFGDRMGISGDRILIVDPHMGAIFSSIRTGSSWSDPVILKQLKPNYGRGTAVSGNHYIYEDEFKPASSGLLTAVSYNISLLDDQLPGTSQTPFITQNSGTHVGQLAISKSGLYASYSVFFPNSNISGGARGLYIFTPASGIWVQMQIIGASGFEAFEKVIFSGDRFITNITGGTVIYKRNGGTWILEDTLPGGSGISISGDTAVVGVPSEGSASDPESGAVYIYIRNGSDWILQQRIVAAIPVGAARFGSSVALEDDRLIVGAPFETISSNGLQIDAGAAYVFSRTSGVWRQDDRVTAPTPLTSRRFGTSIELSADTFVVSEPNAPLNDDRVYAYRITGVTIPPEDIDTDGDGMNDAAETALAALGFNPAVNNSALVNTYFENAHRNGLFTEEAIQTLRLKTPVLKRDQATARFMLTLGLEESTDLKKFTPFPFTGGQCEINGIGELEFEFEGGSNASYFRVIGN